MQVTCQTNFTITSIIEFLVIEFRICIFTMIKRDGIKDVPFKRKICLYVHIWCWLTLVYWQGSGCLQGYRFRITDDHHTAGFANKFNSSCHKPMDSSPEEKVQFNHQTSLLYSETTIGSRGTLGLNRGVPLQRFDCPFLFVKKATSPLQDVHQILLGFLSTPIVGSFKLFFRDLFLNRIAISAAICFSDSSHFRVLESHFRLMWIAIWWHVFVWEDISCNAYLKALIVSLMDRVLQQVQTDMPLTWRFG